jgi:hypothetical protein
VPAGIFMTALDLQKINSGIYFAVAALLISLTAMRAGRKVQRNLKGKRIASVVTMSIVIFGSIWLLSALKSTRGRAANVAS